MRSGGWQTTVGFDLEGKTLGLIGLGNLGAKVARIGKAIGMKTIAWSENLTPERAREHGAERVDKDELFRQADVISINTILSPRTRGLVGAREFGLMKPTALLINTSRGPIVDEAALLAALREKRIGGYGADVYDSEPLPAVASVAERAACAADAAHRLRDGGDVPRFLRRHGGDDRGRARRQADQCAELIGRQPCQSAAYSDPVATHSSGAIRLTRNSGMTFFNTTSASAAVRPWPGGPTNTGLMSSSRRRGARAAAICETATRVCARASLSAAGLPR